MENGRVFTFWSVTFSIKRNKTFWMWRFKRETRRFEWIKVIVQSKKYVLDFLMLCVSAYVITHSKIFLKCASVLLDVYTPYIIKFISFLFVQDPDLVVEPMPTSSSQSAKASTPPQQSSSATHTSDNRQRSSGGSHSFLFKPRMLI